MEARFVLIAYFSCGMLSRRYCFSSITWRKWLVWLYQARYGYSAWVLHAGKESWAVFCYSFLPQRTRLLQIIPPLQPDRKARQSKNIRWNFIMPWQYIWLAWHWLNHLPFIFPWLCKSSKSRFSRLYFEKLSPSMKAQRSRNVTQCPWPLIVIVPSLRNCFCGHTMLIYCIGLYFL